MQLPWQIYLFCPFAVGGVVMKFNCERRAAAFSAVEGWYLVQFSSNRLWSDSLLSQTVMVIMWQQGSSALFSYVPLILRGDWVQRWLFTTTALGKKKEVASMMLPR